jgi:hypothetical protein
LPIISPLTISHRKKEIVVQGITGITKEVVIINLRYKPAATDLIMPTSAMAEITSVAATTPSMAEITIITPAGIPARSSCSIRYRNLIITVATGLVTYDKLGNRAVSVAAYIAACRPGIIPGAITGKGWKIRSIKSCIAKADNFL